MVLILLGALALAYANALEADFQYDDYAVIVDNPAVHSLAAWARSADSIRPLLKASFALNWVVNSAPWGFHLANLALHGVNALLLWALGRRFLMDRKEDGQAWIPGLLPIFVALLFALHPVHTEAVTYISGRSVAFMATFYLASLLAWVEGRAQNSRILVLMVSPGFFLLAFLVRETAITLPVALLLWAKLQERDHSTDRPVWWDLLPHGVLLMGLAVLLAWHRGYVRLLSFGFQGRSLADNLLSQLDAVFYLLTKLVWPTNLNIDPRLPVRTEWSTALAWKAFLLAAILGFALMAWRRRPGLAFGILWFFLHLLPTNSVIPRLDVVNERQLYLASAGLFLGLSRECAPILRHPGLLRSLAMVAFATLAIAMGWLTRQRNADYRTEISLWESSARAGPHNPRAFNNLGCAYLFAGNQAKAREALTTALRLDPDYAWAKANLKLCEADPPLTPMDSAARQ